MKNIFRIFWRFGRIFFFYPAMIVLMVWIDYKNFHWIFGLGVIAAILILDPMWRNMTRNGLRMWRNRSR